MSKPNGNELKLSPELVKEILDREEAACRRASFAPQDIAAIIRYGAIVGSRIEQYPRLARNMDRARSLISDHEEKNRSFPSGTVIIAEELTAGRGRFHRPWHAPRGGVWLTLILVNTLLPENNRLYPLAAGAACCEVLRQYGVKAHVKWVNDVQVNGRKIAGVLTESMTGSRHKEEYVLIGVGMNVNNETFPDALAGSATALKSETGRPAALGLLAARLLAKLAWNIGLLHFEEQRRLLENNGGPAGDTGKNLLLDRWLQLSDMVGRRVLFGYDVQKEPQYEAVVAGIDPDGSIILRLPDNSLTRENSGEIIYL